jgi:hypothetical protein
MRHAICGLKKHCKDCLFVHHIITIVELQELLGDTKTRYYT